MKQNLIAFVAALVMASAAFGQTGVSFQTPKIESQVPQPIAGLTGVVCLDTALGAPCAPTVSVFSDKALAVPITLTTDGDGMFPTFFVAPGQYQWCASDILGRISAYCTKFTAPAASGSSPTFAAITVTGNSALNGNVSVGGTLGVPKVDGICYLDGVTNATLAAAITCASTSGTIEIPPSAGTVSVSVNATIPAGVTLRIDKGAVLAIANAVTVTINGPFSTDGAYQVFSLTGTGTVVMSRSSASAAYVEWFGGAGDNSTDNTAALNAAINISNNAAAMPIQFLCGQYLFNSKPNSFGVGTAVSGCATGSTTTSGTFLIANYTEATCVSATNCNGFLTWDGSFSTALGTGGGLRYMTLYKAANKTVGAAIKLTGADDNHRAGWWRGDHVLVTGSQAPAGTFSYGWLVDGHNNTTAGTQGIRDNACTDCWFTNTSVADSSLFFVNCAKCFWIGGELFQAGGAAGSAGATVTGTGGVAPATADSVEVTLMGTISGDVVVDQASNVRIVSEHVLNNASFSSNTTNSNLIGRVDGTVTNSSTTSVMQVDGVSNTNNTLSNVGGPIGAVASGQTPPTQTAGRVYSREGATSGTMMYGDGSCFTSMASAGVFNLNCGNNATFNMAGTGTINKVPIWQSVEGTAPSAAASSDICYGDSTLHALKCSYNNGTFFQVPQVITATSAAFATATTAGTCVQSATAVTGATTAMTVQVSPVSTPGVGAVWSAFVSSAGNITINECAVAASAGGSIAFNIRVTP